MDRQEIQDFLLQLRRRANRRGSKLMVIIVSCCFSTNNVQDWKTSPYRGPGSVVSLPKEMSLRVSGDDVPNDLPWVLEWVEWLSD
jgi:hypothetical protein